MIDAKKESIKRVDSEAALRRLSEQSEGNEFIEVKESSSISLDLSASSLDSYFETLFIVTVSLW